MAAASVEGDLKLDCSFLKKGPFSWKEQIFSSLDSGVDFTYQMTSFQGNKNFLVGVSGMYANRVDLPGDQTAFAFKADYPNVRCAINFSSAWNPTSILTFEFLGPRNIGRLPFGDFE